MSTNDIDVYTPSLPAQYVSERPMRLIEWAEEARAANQLAQALCQTPFAGAYAGNPGGATAAILKGAEVGLTPVTALGAFDLIQGTPAPKAITLRALVQSHGHRVWIESSTDIDCVAKAIRKGDTEVHVSHWTLKRAQLMGLTNKANWKNQPAAMLMARATSEVCRLVAADVILGIGYSAEELRDEAPEPTVRVSRAKAEKPAMPEPEFEPVAAIEPETFAPAEPDLTPDTITPKQLKMLHTLLTDQGLGDRDDSLRTISKILQRDVASSKDLSKADASTCIDALNAVAEAPFEGDVA